MEVASVLAGEAWSDHPGSVQPVLAAVARVVNDSVGEEDLAGLEHLIPAMIGTATDDVESYARLVFICATAALSKESVRHHPDIRAEVESARRMARRAGRPGAVIPDLLLSSPMAQRWYRRTAVRQAAMAAAAMAGNTAPDRIALCELLEACVRAVGRRLEVAC